MSRAQDRPTLTRRQFAQALLALSAIGALPGCTGSGRSTSSRPTRKLRMDFDLSHSLSDSRTREAFMLRVAGRHYPLTPHTDSTRSQLAADHPIVMAGGLATHFVEDIDVPADVVSLMRVTHEVAGARGGEHGLSLVHVHTPARTLGRRGSTAKADDQNLAPDADSASPIEAATALIFHHPEIMSLHIDQAADLIDVIQASSSFQQLVDYISATGGAFEHDPQYEDGWAILTPLINADGSRRTDSNGDTVYSYDLPDATAEPMNAVIEQTLRAVKNDVRFKTDPESGGVGKWHIAQGVAAPALDSTAGVALAKSGEFRVTASAPIGSTHNGLKWQSVDLLGGSDRTVTVGLNNFNFKWFTLHAEWIDKDGNPLELSAEQWAASFPDQSVPFGPAILSSDTRQLFGVFGSPPVFLGAPIPSLGQSFTFRFPDGAVHLRLHAASLGGSGQFDADMCVVPLCLTAIFNFLLPGYQLARGTADTTQSVFKLMVTTPGVWFALVGYLASALSPILTLAEGPLSSRDYDRAEQDISNSALALITAVANRAATLMLGVLTRTLESPAVYGEDAIELQEVSAEFVGAVGEDEAEADSAEVVEDAIPTLGWALRAAEIAASAVDIAVATAEVVAEPWVSTNEITITGDVVVTIHPDLDDFAFPATATEYEVILHLGRHATRTSGRIPLNSTTAQELTRTLHNVPLGGDNLIIEAHFYSASGWLAGAGFAGDYRSNAGNRAAAARQGVPADVLATLYEGNASGQKLAASYATTPDFTAALADILGEDAASLYRRTLAYTHANTRVALIPDSANTGTFDFEITILENRVPLDANTRYNYRQSLVYDGAAYRWQTGSAPVATQAELSCGTGEELCEPASLSVTQRPAGIGATWRSSSQHLASCGTDTANTQLFASRNLSLREPPGQALKYAELNGAVCGVPAGALLAYDLDAPVSGHGNHFLIDASSGDIHTRRVVVSPDNTPYVLGSGQSFGKWRVMPADIAVHPAGRLVGVEQSGHRLFILDVRGDPLADADAPWVEQKSGYGSLYGRMDTPVAVSCSSYGLIYVLEAGNRRVQAFDLFGNPYAAFRGLASFPVDRGDGAAQLLDMVVEKGRFIFVLSATGGGVSAGDYHLDIYSPAGEFVSRTGGVPAARIDMDFWRNLYTLDYASFVGARQYIEPQISQWIPSTPAANPVGF